MRIQAQCLRNGDVIVRDNGILPLTVTECIVRGPKVIAHFTGWSGAVVYARETLVTIEAR